MRTLMILALLGLPVAGGDLGKAIEAIIDAPEYEAGRWGILVMNAQGQTLYARNAEKLFAPASVTKIFSGAAALVALGPDHRFETPVYAVGKISDGVLSGDLVLVASGDLTFGGRDAKDGTRTLWVDDDHIYLSGWSRDVVFPESNPVHALEVLAQAIKTAGVTRITGEVLIDDRLFASSEGSGSGPRVVSPIMVNDNLIDIILTPGANEGDPATLSTRPRTAYFQCDMDVTTFVSPKAVKDRGTLKLLNNDPREFVVRGEMPVGGKPLTAILPIRKPAEFARTLFIEALRREGVQVFAPLVRSPAVSELPRDYTRWKPIATFTSRPVSEAITVTLKVSHNLYASALPHLVAVKRKAGRTLPDGMRAQGEVLKEIGIDIETISFGGGAGGSNADHVTPATTVALLRAMRKRKEWDAFKNALPVLGVDGTLAGSVSKESPARGKVFAKTGTLFWDDLLNNRSYLTSKALAGTMTTRSGEELMFALFENDIPLPGGAKPSREGRVLGKICEVIWQNVP